MPLIFREVNYSPSARCAPLSLTGVLFQAPAFEALKGDGAILFNPEEKAAAIRTGDFAPLTNRATQRNFIGGTARVNDFETGVREI